MDLAALAWRMWVSAVACLYRGEIPFFLENAGLGSNEHGSAFPAQQFSQHAGAGAGLLGFELLDQFSRAVVLERPLGRDVIKVQRVSAFQLTAP